MKVLAAVILALSAVAGTALSQPADRAEPNVYYDLYIEDSCLTVWVDLAPFLTPRIVERLKDGIELAIELRAELVTPRRFWGDQSFADRTRTFRLSFRRVTGEFVLSSDDPDLIESPFLSQEDLGNALSDSALVCLDQIAQLSSDKRYVVILRVTTISLTDLNLAQEPPDSSGSESPVKFLFRQFLRLTDYGRHQVTARTRPFLVSELEEIN